MQYYHAEKGSLRKTRAGRELSRTIVHRKHLDDSVKLIGEMLFGLESGLQKLTAVRPAGSVVVDDWACLKSMVRMLHIACPKLLLSSAGFLLVFILPML
jgi:legumain